METTLFFAFMLLYLYLSDMDMKDQTEAKSTFVVDLWTTHFGQLIKTRT
jgi:hypothetical protein